MVAEMKYLILLLCVLASCSLLVESRNAGHKRAKRDNGPEADAVEGVASGGVGENGEHRFEEATSVEGLKPLYTEEPKFEEPKSASPETKKEEPTPTKEELTKKDKQPGQEDTEKPKIEKPKSASPETKKEEPTPTKEEPKKKDAQPVKKDTDIEKGDGGDKKLDEQLREDVTKGDVKPKKKNLIARIIRFVKNKREQRKKKKEKDSVTPSGSAQGGSKLGLIGEFAIVSTWLFQLAAFNIKNYLPMSLQTTWSLWVKWLGGVTDDAVDANQQFNFL